MSRGEGEREVSQGGKELVPIALTFRAAREVCLQRVELGRRELAKDETGKLVFGRMGAQGVSGEARTLRERAASTSTT